VRAPAYRKYAHKRLAGDVTVPARWRWKKMYSLEILDSLNFAEDNKLWKKAIEDVHCPHYINKGEPLPSELVKQLFELPVEGQDERGCDACFATHKVKRPHTCSPAPCPNPYTGEGFDFPDDLTCDDFPGYCSNGSIHPDYDGACPGKNDWYICDTLARRSECTD
jgi:hypothetical protein